MRTKPVTKNTEISQQNSENRSPSTQTVPSKPKVDGAHSRWEESDEHRAHTTQNWAVRQLLSVRKCVLEVMGSILKGNEALRHRLLDLQLGSTTEITDADIGGCTLASWNREGQFCLWHTRKEMRVNGERSNCIHVATPICTHKIT